jgi:hypothetical protein
MPRNDGAERLLVLLWKSIVRLSSYSLLIALLKLLIESNISY